MYRAVALAAAARESQAAGDRGGDPTSGVGDRVPPDGLDPTEAIRTPDTAAGRL